MQGRPCGWRIAASTLFISNKLLSCCSDNPTRARPPAAVQNLQFERVIATSTFMVKAIHSSDSGLTQLLTGSLSFVLHSVAWMLVNLLLHYACAVLAVRVERRSLVMARCTPLHLVHDATACGAPSHLATCQGVYGLVKDSCGWPSLSVWYDPSPKHVHGVMLSAHTSRLRLSPASGASRAEPSIAAPIPYTDETYCAFDGACGMRP